MVPLKSIVAKKKAQTCNQHTIFSLDRASCQITLWRRLLRGRTERLAQTHIAVGLRLLSAVGGAEAVEGVLEAARNWDERHSAHDDRLLRAAQEILRNGAAASDAAAVRVRNLACDVAAEVLGARAARIRSEAASLEAAAAAADSKRAQPSASLPDHPEVEALLRGDEAALTLPGQYPSFDAAFDVGYSIFKACQDRGYGAACQYPSLPDGAHSLRVYKTGKALREQAAKRKGELEEAEEAVRRVKAARLAPE